MMNYLLQLGAVFLLSVVACSSTLASHVNRLPADADVVFSIGQIADLREKLNEHPIRELANNPNWVALGKAFSGLGQEIDEPAWEEFEKALADDFELTVDEFFELFPGEISFSLFRAADVLSGQLDRLEFALLADFKGTEKRLDELMRIQFERNASAHKEVQPEVEHELREISFLGETLYVDEVFDGVETYVEDGYALVDGILILATPEERLKTLVESVKLGEIDTLAQTEPYLKWSEASRGTSDFSVFFHFDALLQDIEPALQTFVDNFGLAMVGVTGQSLDAALSLDSIEAYCIDVSITEDGFGADAGILYSEKSGLLSILSYDGGRLPEANFVPNGALSTSVANFDISHALTKLEGLIYATSPSLAPLIDIRLDQLKTATGVDLRSSVLENFGTELATFAHLPTRSDDELSFVEPEQFIAIEIQDADSISRSIEALLDSTPYARSAIEIKQFEGETIYIMRAPNGSGVSDVCVSVSRNHFFLHQGSVAVMQEAIVAYQAGTDGFWQAGSTEEVFAKLGVKDPVARSYVDLGQMIRPILMPTIGVMKMSGMEVPDLTTLPDHRDFPYLMISESFEDQGGFYTRMVLMPKEEE